jgi:alkaline phosphatase
MVEGSKVDWGAHANDPVACITEFLAFDKAIGAAADFAKTNGETVIVVLSDHGNSGFTIGRRDLPSYDRASLEKLFGGVAKIKRTSQGLEELLLKEKPERFKDVFREYTDIDLTDEDVADLSASRNYKLGDYTKASSGRNMGNVIVSIFNKHLWFGFTTGGHTGEEVFLAAYHPQGDIPVGMNTNRQINAYLFDAMGMKTPLPELTKKIFAKHTEVFKGLNCEIEKSKYPVLRVKKGANTLEIPAFKSVASLNGTPIDLGSVTVYIDKNNTFYLPEWLAGKLK